MVTFAGVTVTGCSDPSSTPAYQNTVCVSGFLVAGRTIDSIYVTRTGRLEEKYTPASVAIANALVIVSGNGIDDTLRYDPNKPGRYYSGDTVNKVASLQRYTLTVVAPNYPVVTGSTLVPDSVEIVDKNSFPKVIHYSMQQGAISLGWRTTPQNVYADFVIAITSLDTLETTRELRQDENKPEATSYTFNFFEFQQTQLPLGAFQYYGRNVIAVSAIDKNYYDFIRQAVVGGTDIKEITYNLSGGIGVFGSASIDTLQVMLVK